jgi:DNA-binding GntR family transcriptional regulator
MEYLTKSDIVTAALREMLITGQLTPGAELRQRDLARRFNVSPTPVREALRRLESEGLVDYDAHRGATVTDTDFEPDEENYLVRALLEGLAVSLAADRIESEDLVALHTINATLAECDGDPRLAVDLNRKLHFRIYETARSPLLLVLLRLLWQSFPPDATAGRPLSESVAQHEEIIEFVGNGDGEGAQAALHRHILGGRTSPTRVQITSIAAQSAG